MNRRAQRGVAASAAVLALTVVHQARVGTTEQLADPFYCAVVTDNRGNTVYTACVPWLLD